MGFKRFSYLLTFRLCLIMACLLTITVLLSHSGYQATLLLIALVLIALIAETLRFINKTNAELVRFLQAVKHGELTQRFDYRNFGTAFEQLGASFTEILFGLQQSREEQERTLRHLKALVEQVPVPLLSVHNDGRLTYWNHSARRLFGNNAVQRIDDMSLFGDALPAQLANLKPGEKQLVDFENEGMSHQLALSATQIVCDGKQEKLVSLQDIRSELDSAQLRAWQDLVRVLTHEIMNSITPVASLADTASDLVDDVLLEHALSEGVKLQLDDVADAVKRLSRRSNSLMQFVSSYRQLTRLPEPVLKPVNAKTLLSNITKLATQDWAEKDIEIAIDIEPDPLYLQADAGMVEQVILNLLKNAEHALSGCAAPRVDIRGYINRRGHGVIEVADNGPGIEEDIIEKVFVPFFTTKREGSGVGLALTRQIMIAHGGSVKVTNHSAGGACFSLLF